MTLFRLNAALGPGNITNPVKKLGIISNNVAANRGGERMAHLHGIVGVDTDIVIVVGGPIVCK